MGYLTDKETKELESCKSVSQMLRYLELNFDLNMDPPIVSKIMIVSGLKTALNILKPKRKK